MLEDGAVRALTILNDPQAPTRYDYQIDVEGGIILKPTDDGAIASEGPDKSSRRMILEYVNPMGTTGMA